MYTYKVISFFLKFYSIFLVISVQGLAYGPNPVKRGCVVHCVTSKNNQISAKRTILQMEKTGPPDLVFQRILENEIPSDR